MDDYDEPSSYAFDTGNPYGVLEVDEDDDPEEHVDEEDGPYYPQEHDEPRGRVDEQDDPMEHVQDDPQEHVGEEVDSQEHDDPDGHVGEGDGPQEHASAEDGPQEDPHVDEEDEWMPRVRVITPRSWRRTGRRQLKHRNRRRSEKRRRRRRQRRGVGGLRRRAPIRGGADTGEGQVCCLFFVFLDISKAGRIYNMRRSTSAFCFALSHLIDWLFGCSRGQAPYTLNVNASIALKQVRRTSARSTAGQAPAAADDDKATNTLNDEAWFMREDRNNWSRMKPAERDEKRNGGWLKVLASKAREQEMLRKQEAKAIKDAKCSKCEKKADTEDNPMLICEDCVLKGVPRLGALHLHCTRPKLTAVPDAHVSSSCV